MTQTPILTLTPNPALDISTDTPKVEPGPKLRCGLPRIDPGGGGINVARAIVHLGGSATALVATGGPTGVALVARLKQENVPVLPFPAPGETRQSLAVTETSTGQQYRFVLPGPDWTERDTAALIAAAARACAPAGVVVLSGSLPPGMNADVPSRLTAALAGLGCRLFVDTSGPALEEVVATRGTGARPAVLRMDGEEAAETAGRPLSDLADTAALARSLVAEGAARMVILARGAEGSVLATDDGAWHAAPPLVQEVSRVGAGDSFVGGFTLALARGEPPEEALRLGVAAAAAAVTTEATDLCRAEDVARLLPLTTLTAL